MSVGMNAPATWETCVHIPGGEPFTPSRETEGRLPGGWEASECLLLQLRKAPCSRPAPSAAQESWQWARPISRV